MSTLRVPKRARGLGACLVVVALALMVAAYASSSSYASSARPASAANVAAAKAIVAKLEQPVPFTVPAVGKKVPSGKSLDIITCTLPICATDAGKGVKKLGWKTTTVQFDASKGPQAYVAAWEQTLQRKPDYILTVGIYPPTLITKQLAQAKAEHIPVISVVGLANNPAFISCINCSTGLGEAGTTAADIVISRGATGSTTLSLGDPTNVGFAQTQAGLNAEFARLHAGPSPATLVSSLTQSTAANNAAVVNYVQAHPQITTVINTNPDTNSGLPAALKEAGLSGKVTYYVSAPQVSDINYIKEGEEGPAVAIMNNASWWHAVDIAVRSSVGDPVPANPGGWHAILTKKNAAAMLAAGGSSRPEPPHYEMKYLAAWGVK